MKAWEWKHGLLESHDHWKIWCRWGPPFSMFTFFDSQICRVIDGALYRCLFLLVVYNFDGKVNHGLPLTIGETVHIFEECSGEIRSSFLPLQHELIDHRYFLIDLTFRGTYVYWSYYFRDFCIEEAVVAVLPLEAHEDSFCLHSKLVNVHENVISMLSFVLITLTLIGCLFNL